MDMALLCCYHCDRANLAFISSKTVACFGENAKILLMRLMRLSKIIWAPFGNVSGRQVCLQTGRLNHSVRGVRVWQCGNTEVTT